MEGNIQSKSRSGLHYIAFGHRCYMNPPAQGIILDTLKKWIKKSSFLPPQGRRCKTPRSLAARGGNGRNTRQKTKNPGRYAVHVYIWETQGWKDENGHFCCLPHPFQHTLTEHPAQPSHNPASGRQWGRDFCYTLVSCLCLHPALDKARVWIIPVPLLLPAALCNVTAEFREFSQKPGKLRQPQGLITKHFMVIAAGTRTSKNPKYESQKLVDQR